MHADAGIFLLTDQQAPPRMLKAINTNFETQRNRETEMPGIDFLGVHIIKENLNAATINKTTNCSWSNQKESWMYLLGIA